MSHHETNTSSSTPQLTVAIMCKNEHARIGVTLESVRTIADLLVIFDTGSEDNTVQICKDFAATNNIPLELKEGPFVDFSTSRNMLLNYTDEMILARGFRPDSFILMLDTNDELRGVPELRAFMRDFQDRPESAFLVAQEWWSGMLNFYSNVRLIKANSGWRYCGVVHEFIRNISNNSNGDQPKVPAPVLIYQDRTKDDDKSAKRFTRDRELLEAEHIRDPDDPRTTFYLAQTCVCLGDLEAAYKYYLERSEAIGFYEERYESMFCLGNVSLSMGKPFEHAMGWYLKSFAAIQRAEPLVKLSLHYIKQEGGMPMVYMFASLACKLAFPTNCILFVDRMVYEYTRWHLMGISAFYVGSYIDGKEACLNAIENGRKLNIDVATDIGNLQFYNTVLEEHPNFTRNLYVKERARELTLLNPKIVDAESSAVQDYAVYFKRHLLKLSTSVPLRQNSQPVQSLEKNDDEEMSEPTDWLFT